MTKPMFFYDTNGQPIVADNTDNAAGLKTHPKKSEINFIECVYHSASFLTKFPEIKLLFIHIDQDTGKRKSYL